MKKAHSRPVSQRRKGGEARHQAPEQAAELGAGTQTISRQALRAGLGEPNRDV